MPGSVAWLGDQPVHERTAIGRTLFLDKMDDELVEATREGILFWVKRSLKNDRRKVTGNGCGENPARCPSRAKVEH